MLSQTLKKSLNTVRKSKQLFSTVQSKEVLDKWVKTPADQELENFEPNFIIDGKPEWEFSKTSQGIQVVTEKTQYPSLLDLGILAKMGSRNETLETSGASFLLQSLHMAYGDNPQNFIDNYNKTQFSGAQVQMQYDYETTYWKSSSIHEDQDAMLDLLMKTSLGEKKYVIMDASVLAQNQEQPIDDLIVSTAYGKQGLGMPLCGANDQMQEETFLQFQRNFLTPNRTIISAANIQNHQEFVEKVDKKLNEFPEFLQRQEIITPPTRYVGGETRQEVDDNEFNFAICFETVNWKHEDMAAFQVINTILGNSSSFSTGGPGKGMHSRTSKNLLNVLYYMESASSINHHFTESGLFGIKVSGPNTSRNDLIRAAILELKKFQDPIDPVELLRGQNMLYSLINLSLERQVDRLEEITKNLFSFEKIKLYEYENDIFKVTSDQINNLVTKLLQSQPTIVLSGKGINSSNSVYTYDQILNLLK